MLTVAENVNGIRCNVFFIEAAMHLVLLRELKSFLYLQYGLNYCKQLLLLS